MSIEPKCWVKVLFIRPRPGKYDEFLLQVADLDYEFATKLAFGFFSDWDHEILVDFGIESFKTLFLPLFEAHLDGWDVEFHCDQQDKTLVEEFHKQFLLMKCNQ
jgi:hypothetical protein